MFNFVTLQELRKLYNLLERLHSSLIGFDKALKQCLREQPESSCIPASLQTIVLFKLFHMQISVVDVK